MNGGDNGLVPNACETARYIEQFARELKGMAQKANLAFLAFLLAMAEDEAVAVLKRLGGSGGDSV